MAAASASASASAPVPHSISGSIAGGVQVVPPADMIRFGPVYGADTEANKKAKELAWEHILKEGGGGGGGGCGYLGSITADIEKQVLESYGYEPALNQRKGSDFREMMVKDGCFFIQLALHILGVWELLGYSQQHPYFGKEAPSTSWIQAMFFVRNQIPCVVIRALMKQSFFAKVIEEGSKKGAWKRQPSEDDLVKLVLYRTVVEPELVKPDGRRRGHFKSTPTDVLHALHAMLLGPADEHPNYSEMKDFRDLEAGLDDSKKNFPSAGELYKSGITLRKARTSSGIANIHFKNRVFWAYLDVPPLTIDAHTGDMLTNMAEHERGLSESEREVTAYIRFMRDLAHTYKDFKILENKGIIHVNGESLKGKSLQMLDTIVTHHKCNFTLNFRQTIQMIEGYGGPPWRIISIVLGVFTIIQTIFTVLSYFFPPRTLA